MLVWLQNIQVQIETDTETRSEGFSKIYVTAACFSLHFIDFSLQFIVCETKHLRKGLLE